MFVSAGWCKECVAHELLFARDLHSGRIFFVCAELPGVTSRRPRGTRGVELPPFGKCHDATRDRERLCGEGPQSPDHLHARGTFGGKAMNDPIVDEVRRVRDAHAAMFNYDLDAIFRDIKEQEKTSGLKFVSYPPRRTEPNKALQPTGAANAVSPDSTSPEAAPAAEL
jgi:hypothetical protein